MGGDFCEDATRESLTFTEMAEKLLADNPDYYSELKQEWDQGNFYILLGMQ